jgi:hypothetical protein
MVEDGPKLRSTTTAMPGPREYGPGTSLEGA